jgi:hypothetical protein
MTAICPFCGDTGLHEPHDLCELNLVRYDRPDTCTECERAVEVDTLEAVAEGGALLVIRRHLCFPHAAGMEDP